MNEHGVRHLPPKSELSPITLRIADACRITGIGRSKLYELIKAGELEVIKVGAMTLVPMASIEALLGRGRAAGSDGAIAARLRAVMHPALAKATLTAVLAKVPHAIRRDLASSNDDRKIAAEDALVEELIEGLYGAEGDTLGMAA